LKKTLADLDVTNTELLVLTDITDNCPYSARCLQWMDLRSGSISWFLSLKHKDDYNGNLLYFYIIYFTVIYLSYSNYLSVDFYQGILHKSYLVNQLSIVTGKYNQSGMPNNQ